MPVLHSRTVLADSAESLAGAAPYKIAPDSSLEYLLGERKNTERRLLPGTLQPIETERLTGELPAVRLNLLSQFHTARA